MTIKAIVYAACAVTVAAYLLSGTASIAQENKKTDDDKPADPDTGESTVEEKTSACCRILGNKRA